MNCVLNSMDNIHTDVIGCVGLMTTLQSHSILPLVESPKLTKIKVKCFSFLNVWKPDRLITLFVLYYQQNKAQLSPVYNNNTLLSWSWIHKRSFRNFWSDSSQWVSSTWNPLRRVKSWRVERKHGTLGFDSNWNRPRLNCTQPNRSDWT